MNVFFWIAFGLIAGAGAYFIDPKGSRGGFIGTILFGVLGAVAGGFIANILFGGRLAMFDFPAFLIAIIGTILLLFVERSVFSEPTSKF